MKILFKQLYTVLFFMGLFFAGLHAQEGGIPLSESELNTLEKELKGDGLVGRIHGINENVGTYVFTWRDPNNFFRSAFFTLVTRDQKNIATLNTLTRHDKVKIKGEFLQNDAPQKHIALGAIEIIEKNKAEQENTNACVPTDIYEKSEMTALVHASLSDGNILLVDIKDVILPVYVTDNKWTKGLYRNDIIKFKYIVRSFPKRPTHLELDVNAENALVLLDSMVAQNGQEKTIEGALVRFDKSPSVIFDVYALEVSDALGIKRNYTLVNFESPEIFKAIREKSALIWNAMSSTAVDGRNKFVNRKIKVSATGLINVQTKDQANPQILLKSADDLKFSKEVCHYEEIL